VSLLWNTTSNRVGFLPSFVPKLTGTVGLLAMIAALVTEETPQNVTLALSAGIMFMLASFKIRRMGIATSAFAVMGIAYFFSNYAVSFGDQVTWTLTAGLGGCGVALISSIMVITDER